MAKKKKVEGQLSLDFPASSPQEKAADFGCVAPVRLAHVTSLEDIRRLKMREILVSNLRGSGLLSLRKA